MYFAQHTQTGDIAFKCRDPYDALKLAAELGWEECETELMEGDNGNGWTAEFPCTYSFHYGEEHHTCELTSNRPDSYCEVHSA